MRRATILIIEDNWAVFEFIKAALTTYPQQEEYQYQVIHAQDGIDGLDQIWLHRPDLILLDIRMPRLDGYETLRSLRGIGASIPVIMMTANPGQHEQQRVFDAGGDAYITKPFAISTLHCYIQSLLIRRNKDSITDENETPTVEAARAKHSPPSPAYASYRRG